MKLCSHCVAQFVPSKEEVAVNTYSSSFNRSYKLVAVFLVVIMGTVTMLPTARSQDSTAHPASQGTEGGTASSASMQAAAGVSTLLYLPVKLVFAIGGGIVGGFAYVFSEQAAKSIWSMSVYGTYVLTPDHLQGNRPILFLGVPDSNDAPAPTPVQPEGLASMVGTNDAHGLARFSNHDELMG